MNKMQTKTGLWNFIGTMEINTKCGLNVNAEFKVCFLLHLTFG